MFCSFRLSPVTLTDWVTLAKKGTSLRLFAFLPNRHCIHLYIWLVGLKTTGLCLLLFLPSCLWKMAFSRLLFQPLPPVPMIYISLDHDFSSIKNPIVYSTLSLVSHELRNFVLNHSSVYCTCCLLRVVRHEARFHETDMSKNWPCLWGTPGSRVTRGIEDRTVLLEMSRSVSYTQLSFSDQLHVVNDKDRGRSGVVETMSVRCHTECCMGIWKKGGVSCQGV